MGLTYRRESRQTGTEPRTSSSLFGHDDFVKEADGWVGGRFHLAFMDELIET